MYYVIYGCYNWFGIMKTAFITFHAMTCVEHENLMKKHWNGMMRFLMYACEKVDRLFDR